MLVCQVLNLMKCDWSWEGGVSCLVHRSWNVLFYSFEMHAASVVTQSDENGFMLSDHSASMTSAFSEEVCMPVFKALYTSSSVFLSVFNFDISNTNHYNFFSYYGFCDLNVKSGVICFYRSECCYPFYFLALETVSCCWFSRWQSSLWVSSAEGLQQMLE